jgi:S1-C subfamily serine protease
MQRDSTEGVLVGTVRPGGPVADAKPDIQPGDIIVEVAGRPVRNMADLKDVTVELTRGQSKPRRALVAYERKFEKLLTVVRVGMRPPEPKPAEVSKAWLAAETQVLTRDLASALKLTGKTGVRITQIYPGRNADQAGLKLGDIIVGFDGQPIPAQNPEDIEVFPAMVRQRPLHENVWLDVIRDGQPTRIEVTLEESAQPLRQMKEYKDEYFEFTARQVGFMDRKSQKLQDKPGVVVSAVEPGGWAAVGHLAVGDFIQAVDGRQVDDIDPFEQIMKQIAAQQQQRVVFFVRRGIHTMFLEIEPAWKPGEPPASSACTQPQKEQP